MKKISIWIFLALVIGWVSFWIYESTKKTPPSTDNQQIAETPKTKTEVTMPTPDYPIDSEVLTTLDRVVIPTPVPATSPKILPYEVTKYAQYGYGAWTYGSGLALEKRFDLMGSTYNSGATAGAASLLSFFTISDIHLTDEESPAQAINAGYKGGNIAAYSPSIRYTTQTFEAAIQTVNALHKKSPFDFGLALGDASNNTQYNELRWYIDILDGKKINPDSGKKDDPVTGPLNDYQDEYQAQGLDPTIPWYQAIGNHDILSMGAYPVSDEIRATYIGTGILNMGNVFTDPLGIKSKGFYMGSIDGSTINGDVIGAGPVANFPVQPQVLAADANRRSLTTKEWMAEFLKSTSLPLGHGFSQSNVDKDFASYSFEPKSELPIKVIVLDDTQDPNNFDLKEQGYLDEKRFNWLVNELDKGQEEGKLMIVSAHVPATLVGYAKHSPISREKLISKLNTYSNLVLWVSGHVHRNTITPLKSPNVNQPELGFWQVETSSIRNFPQQFRTIQIVRNTDNTLSIITADVDIAAKEGSLAAASRMESIGADEIFEMKKNLPPSGAYNAELIKQLSPEMQAKIAKLGTPINK